VVADEEINPPATGFRAELVTDLARLEQKLVGLAEAVPEENFGWRPADAVRTTSEVFMHVVASNHRILVAVGFTPPDEVDTMEQIIDKAEVIARLRDSIDAVRRAVMATADADLDSQVEFFGRDWSKRALFYLAATHMHEHLGQSIAYARSVGVVPPWSQLQSDEERE